MVHHGARSNRCDRSGEAVDFRQAMQQGMPVTVESHLLCESPGSGTGLALSPGSSGSHEWRVSATPAGEAGARSATSAPRQQSRRDWGQSRGTGESHIQSHEWDASPT